MSTSRRNFVLAAAAAAPLAAAAEIPRRKLGKTGLEVSVIGLGGARIGGLDDGKQAAAVVRRCYELGINYFDTAAAGAYGLSQRRYGAALAGIPRDKIIYGTKTRNRSATQSQLDLDQSLANLRTDYLDLYQIHNVINDEDIQFIFGPKGVMETVEKAKKAGKVRFVGVTGHTTPAVLTRIIGMYDFATILMPLSVADGGNSQKSFEAETLPAAKKKGMGVIAMKVLGAGAILKNKAATVDECLKYTLTLPVSTAIMGCDEIAHVEHDVALAKSAKPLTAMEMDSLRHRVRQFDYAALEPWKLGSEEDPSGPAYRAD
jgi:aryl-alcohol dehydrogenase-like predicted oxidoreductase